MNSFWNWFVVVITLGNILACLWLIRWSGKRRPGESAVGEVTGHRWDGDLEEYNNPLPRWWLYMFYITIAFGLGYLALFPGLGNFKGLLGWSEVGQYDQEIAQAEQQYSPLFARYGKQPVAALAMDANAMATGRRLFLANCALCHGSDAGGAPGRGFPSLTDQAWLYGGAPETINESILKGRSGVMPPMGAALGGETAVKEVANYVRRISGQSHDAALAKAGEGKFNTICAACHGADGKGSAANGMAGIGAPNLTDRFWLFGGSVQAIETTINHGRSGQMPAWEQRLGPEKVQLLAAYVYSLTADTRGKP